MIEIFKNTNYDFLGKKWVAIALSTLLILVGLVSMVYRAFDGRDETSPFNLGVDFAGGTLATVKFNSTPDVTKLREALGSQGIETAKVTIQPVGDQIGQPPRNEVLVRLPNLVNVVRQEGQSETAAKATDDADIGKQKILAALATLNDPSTSGRVDLNALGKDQISVALVARTGLDAQRAEEVAARIVDYREQSRGGLITDLAEVKNLGGIDPQIGATLEQGFFTGVAAVKSVEAVSPQVGADLRNRAIFVSLVSCLGMLIYVAFRFKSWGFGIGAVVAVFHDVLVTLGFFSIMQWEINLTVIAALLTLIGYSMNDTIVIFDRIRELLRFRRRDSLERLANDAVNETLSRTVITNGLTFLTVFALVLFGGEVLKSFSWALFIGIIVGSYSTVYIASPFMLMWENFRGNASLYNSAPRATVAGSGQVDPAGSTAVSSRLLAQAGVSAKRRRKGR
ncbi:MAG: protein translocase subunit SecF [Acidobacteria bacterium]|nr:protein translocase subunit SecF [Acidobacteriota bacterium]